jgi:hypothetical protein
MSDRDGPVLPIPSYSRLAWELAKACAGFSATSTGGVKASMGLSNGQVVAGLGATTTEALQDLAVELDRWGAR